MKRYSTFIIVIVIHVVIVLLLTFLASREGMLGEKMKTLTTTIIPKPKVIEKPKEDIIPKPIEIPTIPTVQNSIPTKQPIPIVKNNNAVVAPPVAELPSLSFGDVKETISISDPIQLYKSYIEHYLKSQWKIPDRESGIAEVEITIDNTGRIVSYKFNIKEGKEWTKSVEDIINKITSIPKIPPKGFPFQFKVVFDKINE